jgi:serine/threonine protein phosphatase 1
MIYAIGDIHGQLEMLRDAHALIEADARSQGVVPMVVHMGDIVDRGPNARGVIDFLIKGINAGQDWLVLLGNHDKLFLDFVHGGDGRNPRLRAGVTWQSSVMGGAETLKSYGVKRRALERMRSFAARARAAVPAEHVAFLEKCPTSYRAEGMIFVHAGIRPGFALDVQDEDDLLWIRDDFLWHMGPHEALIIHGHTPVDEPTHYGNRINIDTGAGWGNPLVPVVLQDGECFALTQSGRVPVRSPDKYHLD